MTGHKPHGTGFYKRPRKKASRRAPLGLQSEIQVKSRGLLSTLWQPGFPSWPVRGLRLWFWNIGLPIKLTRLYDPPERNHYALVRFLFTHQILYRIQVCYYMVIYSLINLPYEFVVLHHIASPWYKKTSARLLNLSSALFLIYSLNNTLVFKML